MTDDEWDDDDDLDRPASAAQQRPAATALERILKQRGIPYYQSKEQQ